MTTQWLIENIEQTEGSNISNVAWRANGDAGATAYGLVSIEGLTITPDTTEAEVVGRVKQALNAYVPAVDAQGHAIPPKPGEQTAKTDAIEASLAKQAEELAHPKTKSVKLPWAHN